MAEIDETNVMVMLKFTSPSNRRVQKLEAIPPGQVPSTNSPNPLSGSLIKSCDIANANWWSCS